eukprot:4062996-Pyramimonas_sp.AAC.1
MHGVWAADEASDLVLSGGCIEGTLPWSIPAEGSLFQEPIPLTKIRVACAGSGCCAQIITTGSTRSPSRGLRGWLFVHLLTRRTLQSRSDSSPPVTTQSYHHVQTLGVSSGKIYAHEVSRGAPRFCGRCWDNVIRIFYDERPL